MFGKFLRARFDAARAGWQMRHKLAADAGGASAIAGITVGIILSIIAVIVGVQMLPSVISSWVTLSQTTGLVASAGTLTGVGQIVTVVTGIVLVVSVVLIVLKLTDRSVD